MKLRDEDIVTFLRAHPGWQSAKTMAVQFGVSTRTVRNHIVSLNKQQGLVKSGPLGYQVAQGSGTRVLPEEDTDISSRIFLILFNSPDGTASMTDIIGRTYFAELTILDAVTKFNTANRQNKVAIRVHGGNLSLEGKEYDRRRLFHRYAGRRLRNFGQGTGLDLKELIPNIPIETLRQIITSVVNKKNLVINGYEMNDLLLHYAISINRITHGNSYDAFEQDNSITSREEYRLTQEITSKIAEQFNLRFNKFEVQALTLALIGKTISGNPSSKKMTDLEKYVPKRIIESCLRVIERTGQEYNLQLNDPSFQVRFIIHVNNMLSRAAFGQKPQITDFEYLTTQYPLLYEMALYVLESLGEELEVKLSRQESVYLLLHLGAYLEGDQRHLVNAVVIAPEYYDTTSEILDKLDREFGDELRITSVLTQVPVDELKTNSRLIITTQQIRSRKNVHSVRISPLISSIDIAKIRRELDTITHQDWITKNVGYLHRYMDKSLFFADQNFSSKKECLQFGAEQLTSQGYTGPEFIDEINKRESLAATDFGEVALPHTLKMKARHTGIVVILNRKGIDWGGGSKCRLVIMIAVSNLVVHIFGEMFQAMISTLSVKKNVVELLKAKNYEQFLDAFAAQFESIREQDI